MIPTFFSRSLAFLILSIIKKKNLYVGSFNYFSCTIHIGSTWYMDTDVRDLGRVRLESIRNKNNWNNASKRLFGSYSHSGIPGFPFWLVYSQEQNSRNIFRNKFLFRNIPNERALSCTKNYELLA